MTQGASDELYEQVVAASTRGGRVCPKPQAWTRVFDLLPGKRRSGAGSVPSLPLILGAWWESTDAMKMQRFREHIDWAHEHGAIKELASLLLALPQNQWHHLGE